MYLGILGSSVRRMVEMWGGGDVVGNGAHLILKLQVLPNVHVLHKEAWVSLGFPRQHMRQKVSHGSSSGPGIFSLPGSADSQPLLLRHGGSTTVSRLCVRSAWTPMRAPSLFPLPRVSRRTHVPHRNPVIRLASKLGGTLFRQGTDL